MPFIKQFNIFKNSLLTDVVFPQEVQQITGNSLQLIFATSKNSLYVQYILCASALKFTETGN